MTEQDAWFVRRQRGASYQIVPRKLQGWLVLLVYVGFAIAITPVLRPFTSVHVAVWLVLLAAATILFSVIVWRTSVPLSD